MYRAHRPIDFIFVILGILMILWALGPLTWRIMLAIWGVYLVLRGLGILSTDPLWIFHNRFRRR